MHSTLMFEAAAATFGLGTILMYGTSPYRVGGAQYNRRMARRRVGKVFITAAVICLAVGGLAQLLAVM